MNSTKLFCQRCGSTDVIKNGFSAYTGKQQYKCKNCKCAIVGNKAPATNTGTTRYRSKNCTNTTQRVTVNEYIKLALKELMEISGFITINDKLRLVDSIEAVYTLEHNIAYSKVCRIMRANKIKIS